MSGAAIVSVEVGIRRALLGFDDLPLPEYQTEGAAGMDLLAAIPRPMTLMPGQRAVVGTGVAIELPPGYEGQVRSRSGLALQAGVVVLNAPGTIDPDYRGEVGVILANLGDKLHTIQRGQRIAQLVVAPVSRVLWREGALQESARGEGGFGSTGDGGEPCS